MLVFRIAALAVFDWKSRMVSQSYPQLLGLTLLVLIGEILALVLIDLCDILVCPQFFSEAGQPWYQYLQSEKYQPTHLPDRLPDTE